ncbi:phosphotransferase [Candidatus Babeliales bacterium]|nr:phosphotransferase [Candidatus Babeliales bacterium]
MKKILLSIALLVLSACGQKSHVQQTDNKVLAALENAFGSSQNWQVNILKGGLSGAPIFLASKGTDQYVVRFFDHLSSDQIPKLIRAQKAAATSGYGPKIYWDNVEQGAVVMDYLEPEQPDKKNILNDLVILLNKIHQSPRIESSGSLWDLTYAAINKLKGVKQTLLELSAVQTYLEKLVQKVSQNLASKPCHRDMNPGNLIFSKGQFFAVDYDSFGMDDPYIDIAQVAIFYCYSAEAEKQLLTLYLHRQPTDAEMAKLQLFKRIALIFYGMEFLCKVPAQLWQSTPDLIPYLKFLQLLGSKAVALEDPKEKLRSGLIMVREGMKP